MLNAFRDWKFSAAIFIALLAVIFIFSGGVRALAQDGSFGQRLIEQTDARRKLGDDGFMHQWLHQYYQKYFSTIRCPCHEGECRPTTWRRDPGNIRIIQVLINGNWATVGEKTDLRDQRSIPDDFPQQLQSYPAHACAYLLAGKVILTCVWIMGSRI